jgi:Protein of unknown function (DUF2934)
LDANLYDRIRQRAYEIWFATGCRYGEAEQHWLAAEREILHAALAAQPAAKPKRGSAKKVSRPPGRTTLKAISAN